MSMEMIRLNLIPDGELPVVHCKQFDVSRRFRVCVFEGINPYIFTNETVELNVRKSDTHLVTIDLEAVEGRRYVDVITTEQMCVVTGKNECEIRVMKDGANIGSLNFIMEIEKSPTEGGVHSDSEINNLRRQMEEIAEPVIEEVAPPIVERIVSEVIGDNYYNKEQTDALLTGKADVGASYTKAEEDILLGNKADKSDTYTKAQVDSALSGKANVGASYTKSEEDALLANKADSADVYNKQTVDNKLAEKANTSDVNTALATKADKADTYTKSQVDSALSGKANVGVSYTKAEEDNLLSAKANTSDVNTALAGKADKADTYTKSEVDTALGNKADKSTTYTKQETDTLLSGKADKSDTYTKAQVDEKVAGLIDDTTPSTEKVYSSSKVAEIVENAVDSVLPTDSVSKSAIATFETDLAKPMSLKAYIEATQDLHGQSAPYPSGGQLWDETWEVGQYDANGDKINNLAANASIRSKNFIPVPKNTTLYIFVPYSSYVSGFVVANYYDEDKNFISKENLRSKDATISTNEASYITFFVSALYGNTYKNDISLKNVNDSTYHPYTNICPIGGWDSVKVGLTSDYASYFRGLLNGTYGFLDLGSLTWEYQANYNCWRHNGFTSIKVVDNATPVNAISENYTTVKAQGYTTSHNSFTFCVNANKDVFCDNGSTTVSPTGYLIYELATPTTPTITPEQFDTLLTAFGINGTTEVIELGGTYYGGRLLQDKDGHRRFEVTCVKEHFSLSGRSYNTANGYDSWALTLAHRTTPSASSINKKCSVCGTYIYQGSEANTEHFYITTSGAFVIYLTENTFRSGELDVLYPLETPYYIDLPDGEPINALVGTNNLFADSGDSECAYKESVELYVQKRIAEVQALALNS